MSSTVPCKARPRACPAWPVPLVVTALPRHLCTGRLALGLRSKDDQAGEADARQCCSASEGETCAEPIRKAIWYVESHFASPIGLDDIAEVSGLSRFHFSRTFAQTTGLPVSSYLRGRRLSQAAQVLAEGAPNILPLQGS